MQSSHAGASQSSSSHFEEQSSSSQQDEEALQIDVDFCSIFPVAGIIEDRGSGVVVEASGEDSAAHMRVVNPLFCSPFVSFVVDAKLVHGRKFTASFCC